MFALLSILLAQAVQPSPVIGIDGGYLQQTSGTGAYFIDPTGSDANACTSSGSLACATLGGVFSKLPYRVAHAQTITVAAGTYSGAVTFSGIIDANITITGPALANVTPTTGSATGSLTAAVNATPVFVTDGAATWTANDFRGRFLVMTSGAASGNVRPIVSNTSTTITLASPFSVAPSAADTYAIQSPAAIFTDSTVGGDTFRIRALGQSITGNSSVTFTGVEFGATGAGGTAVKAALEGNVILQMTNTRLYANNTSSGVGFSYTNGGTVGFTSSAVVSTGIAFRVVSAAGVLASASPGGRAQVSSVLFYSSGSTSAISLESLGGGMSWVPSVGWTALTNSTSSADAALKVLGIVAASNIAAVGVLQCLQNGPVGLYVPSPTAVSQSTFSARVGFGIIQVYGCNTGLYLQDGQAWADMFVRFDCGLVSGTCIKVADGAHMHVPSTFNTDAGTDINIDGTSYTKANLTGASPTRLPTTPNVQGSSVWQ